MLNFALPLLVTLPLAASTGEDTATAPPLPLQLSSLASKSFSDLPCFEGAQYYEDRIGLPHGFTVDYSDVRTAPIFSWGEARHMIENFVAVRSSLLGQPELWPLGNAPAGPSAWLGDDQEQWLPYMQKVDIPAGAKVAVFGDLHGSFHSLLRTLLHFKQQGLIDDEMKVVAAHKASYFLLFLGDYVDRGHFGVETLLLLLHLQSINPGNVFCVRGNHEDYNMNGPESMGSFQVELKNKYPQLSREDEGLVFRTYDMLPMAILLGTYKLEAGASSGSGSTDASSSGSGSLSFSPHLLCVHGGIELGVDPRPLLADMSEGSLFPAALLQQLLESSSATPFILSSALASLNSSGAAFEFARIESLRRRDWLQAQAAQERNKLVPSKLHHLLKNWGPQTSTPAVRPGSTHDTAHTAAEEPLQHWANADPAGEDAHLSFPADPTGTNPANGLMWSDFVVDDKETSLMYRPNRGFAFGLKLTAHWLKEMGLAGILRAHQHNNEHRAGPMLNRMLEGKGMHDNWGGSGLVLTHLSGAYVPGMDNSFDSHSLLHMPEPSAQSWSLQKCWNSPNPAQFLWYQGRWIPRDPTAEERGVAVGGQEVQQGEEEKEEGQLPAAKAAAAPPAGTAQHICSMTVKDFQCVQSNWRATAAFPQPRHKKVQGRPARGDSGEAVAAAAAAMQEEEQAASAAAASIVTVGAHDYDHEHEHMPRGGVEEGDAVEGALKSEL